MEKLKIFGQLGIFILVLVLIYLILKIAGIVHSVSLEEVLVGVVLGQLFYIENLTSGFLFLTIRDRHRYDEPVIFDKRVLFF